MSIEKHGVEAGGTRASPLETRPSLDAIGKADVEKAVEMLQSPTLTAEGLCELGRGLERVSLRLGVDPDPSMRPLLNIIGPTEIGETFRLPRTEGYLPLDESAKEEIRKAIGALQDPALTVESVCEVGGSMLRIGLRHNPDPDPIMTQLLAAMDARRNRLRDPLELF